MDWESFMDNLTAGQIVPVIGNDLVLVKDEKGESVSLYSYFKKEWQRRLASPRSDQNISELALVYPQKNIRKTTESIFFKMDESRFDFELLRKLADVTDFKFFISTTLDNLLAKALREARNLKEDQLRVINYSPLQLSKIPKEQEADPLVAVFNIFGSFGHVLQPAFDEEEMLEHFFSFSKKHEHGGLADYFMDCVQNKILLFIGCDFPDWFMRFVIRIISNERYKERRVNDYMVWNEDKKYPKLDMFLKQFNKNIYKAQGEGGQENLRRFVDELHNRWMEAVEKRPVQYEETVFLSYYHPDKRNARELKIRLRAMGIQNVWFDEDDLRAGEHRSLIEVEIKRCKVFVPLVSGNSLSNPQSYTWKVEWTAIEGRYRADKFNEVSSFQIIPVIVDDTEKVDERIPGFMREFSIWNLRQDMERIVKAIADVLTPL